jgi:SAM-dependent methyltransferase
MEIKDALHAKIANFRKLIITMILDRYVIWKQRKVSIGYEPGMIDLPSHTVNENRRLWDTYDWSQMGEEWTHDAKTRGLDPILWKESLINDMMFKYIKKDSIILEIGIGAGRWSEVLQPVASRLILTDISKTCLHICEQRFKRHKNVEYHLIEQRMDFIRDHTIDYIWSYDVFVHINPSDVERYIAEINRILKTNGYALIHHSGIYMSEKHAREKGFRSYMTGEIFTNLVEKYGMKIVEQNATLPHIQGDLISVFVKPSP